MKRKGSCHLAWICASCVIVLCSACAAGGKGAGFAEEGMAPGDGENRILGDVVTDNMGQSEALPEPADGPADLSGVSGAGAEAGLQEELTAEELRQFTDFANQAENNGFLLSQYEHISGADLNEILYNGAGMETVPLSQEERRAYEAGGHSIETDIVRLATGQIEEFLQRKAGVGLADMEEGLDWVYLEGFGCYVSQHGDTNFCTFACTGGTRAGQVYELRFKAGGDYASDCVTTLKKSGEGYQFVSNRFYENADDTKPVRKIAEQSFPLELEGWGEVEFVSYGPDILENIQQDAVFCLEQDGEEVFLFPEVRDGNLRVNDRFESIDAVAFRDYDQDGYMDIIILCTYEQLYGEDAGAKRREVRIYKGGEQVFRYMDKLCFALNTQGKNQGISQVLDEIREEPPDLSVLDRDILRQLEIFAKTKEQWVPNDFGPVPFGYTVYDMDGDGRLELLVQLMVGTGMFSYNHFYQAEEDAGGIKELPQELYNGFWELDIGLVGSHEQAFRDEDGTVYYMASDITRNGYAECSYREGAYYLKDGCVYSMVYRGLHEQAQGEDSWVETYYDAEVNEISREEWEGLRESFLEGKEEIPCGISWISAYPEDVGKASTEEILRRLAECRQELRHP